jgi:hypothetical protein
MKLRRGSKTPDVDPAIAQFVGATYFALEDNLECYTRLAELRDDGAAPSELRPEALAGARRIAYVSRMTWEAITHGYEPDSIPQDVFPFQAFGALGRLGYALAALAEEDPEPEQLLTTAEVNGLVAQYGIEEWFHNCRVHSGTGDGAPQ